MQNEILKPVLDTDEAAVPRYDIVGPTGAVIQQNVEFRLKNEVVQEGTPYDEESVLPTSLRERLNLAKTATPAEAFFAVLEEGGAVISNRAPTTHDAQPAGRLWVVPKIIFNNLMPTPVTMSNDTWEKTAATGVASGSAITFTGDGTAATMSAQATMVSHSVAGHIMYVAAEVTAVTAANEITLEFISGGAEVAKTFTLSVPNAGTTTKFEGMITVPSGGITNMRLSAAYNTAGSQSGQQIKIDRIFILDLTHDMSQAAEGLEFTQEEISVYLASSDAFVQKVYDLSQTWWLCWGNRNNSYDWYRYDDLANPLTTSAVGDVLHSANNLEEKTNGVFIAVDGRTIDKVSGYPLLKDCYELKYRVANPGSLSSSAFSCGPHAGNGAGIDGAYFWIASGTSSSERTVLRYRDTSGVNRALLSNAKYLVRVGDYVVAATCYNQGIKAVVYNSAGTQVRDVSLNTATNFDNVFAYVSGSRIIVLAHYSNTCYAYYSDDAFATYGTSNWAGSANSGPNNTLWWNNFSEVFKPIQADASGNLYLLTSDSNAKAVNVWKSTNKGASFTKAYTISTTDTSRVPQGYTWFIDDSYLYIFGKFQENSQCLIKYDLSTGRYIARTTQLASSTSMYHFGFVRDGYAYISSEAFTVRIQLSNMSWETWNPHGTSAYMFRVRTPSSDLITSDGQYWIAFGEYMQGYPSYEERAGNNTCYGMVFVYHIETGRGVFLTGDLYVTQDSSSFRCYLGRPFEDSDGNVIIAQGYESNSKLIKIDFSKVTLPSLDYAYLKVKEMTT